MFRLTIHDSNGIELHIGDLVKISDGKNYKFYSEVKYLNNEKVLAPFHTFCYHRIEKIDKIPDKAVLGIETKYKIWYDKDPETDPHGEHCRAYVMSWLECERLVDKGMYRIELIKEKL